MLSADLLDETLKQSIAVTDKTEEMLPAPQTFSLKKHGGKVSNINELSVKADSVVSAAPLELCPQCHSKSMSVQEVMLKLKDELTDTIDNVEKIGQLSVAYKTFFCEKCGKVYVQMDEKQDFPIVPGRQICTLSIMEFNRHMCIGMPLDRPSKLFEKYAKLGSKTVSYSLNDYHFFYLKPFYQALLKIMKTQRTLIVDETPFNCLHDQGRGRLAKDASEDRDVSSKNYILCTISAPAEKNPIELYHYQRSRSAKSLNDIVTADFKAEVLVTDAYSGYDTLVRQLNESRDKPMLHQNCWVHFRRELLMVILPSEMLKEIGSIPEEQFDQAIEKAVKDNASFLKLWKVLEAVNQLFRIQNIKNPSAELLRQRRSLADLIDLIINELSEKLVERKGSKWVKCSHDPIAKVCVYYKNAREKLRTFLDYEDIPLCTNKVGNAIRPITILRKNCLFKHSPKYMEDMCIAYSIWEIFRINEVERPEAWLRRYSQELFRHMCEKGLTQQWKNTGVPATSFSIKDQKKGQEDKNDPRNAFLPENLAEGLDFDAWAGSTFQPLKRLSRTLTRISC